MTEIILASGSETRQKMFKSAGIHAQIAPPHVDEGTVKESLKAEGAKPLDIAFALAELKAKSISVLYPDALVIGADQILDQKGNLLTKAKNRAQAQATLRTLSGEKHRLLSAAVAVQAGQVIWRGSDRADLTVRPLSDPFISHYLDQLGDRAYNSVGCYHLEGLGAQLFQKVDGDYYTILGFPMLGFMQFLRDRGVILS